MSGGCAIWISGSKGQRPRSQCIDNRKYFMSHNCFPFTPVIMNFHSPWVEDKPPGFWGQKVKGQCYNALIAENVLCCIIPFFTPFIIKLHLKTPHELRICPIDLGVKSQGHNALITENGLCRIIAFPLHLSSWNFIQRPPMTWGYALWVSGSKGQRPRSQCIDNRKWFMSHNCFPFTPIIMEIHTKTPHESRISPMDFGVKRLKVKVIVHW